MKSAYVADLADGQSVSTLFLVREKEVRTSPNTGKSWLHLELADRTGAIEAKMWEHFAEVASTFDRDDIVKVRARVKLYRGEKELTLDQISPAREAEYSLDDFLPHTKKDVEQLYTQLVENIRSVRNPWLRRLLESIVEDPAVIPKLKRAPAAMTMHHAYLGGLLEHIVSLCGLVLIVSAHYPELDKELLLSGAILHDIGKTEELSYARAISYTDTGQLLGHILIALALVRRKIGEIPDFPCRLGTLLEHLIASHHGSYEFGSPRLPLFREAVLLHYLDDMDSKMAAMRESHESAESEAAWTPRNPALRRSLLLADNFLRAETPAKDRDSGAVAAKAAPSGKLFPSPAKDR